MSLGREIRKVRIDKGWQQRDLQKATKISQTYLSQVELDKVDPRLSIVKRIAQALGVGIDRLVQEDPSNAIARWHPESPGFSHGESQESHK
jgi:transcriptional regulator with XRE-family HTH domain